MTQKLPQQIQRLIELIGWAQTLRLLNARGGTAVYFPRDPANAKGLAYIVNDDALEALCREYGDRESTVRLPMPSKMILQMRNRKILDDYRKGVSSAELAAEYGVTDRWVQNILREQQEIA